MSAAKKNNKRMKKQEESHNRAQVTTFGNGTLKPTEGKSIKSMQETERRCLPLTVPTGRFSLLGMSESPRSRDEHVQKEKELTL